jgi:8-oxo-dGTP pyrophosphatase MutT (NUDIX family)
MLPYRRSVQLNAYGNYQKSMEVQDIKKELTKHQISGHGAKTVLVGIGVLYREGKFLLTRAKNHEYWCFPGGLYDVAGESLEDLIAREYREELAADIEVLGPIDNRLDVSSTGNYFRLISFYLVKQKDSRPLRCVDNHDPADLAELRWVSLSEIDSLPTALDTWRIAKKAQWLAEHGLC